MTAFVQVIEIGNPAAVGVFEEQFAGFPIQAKPDVGTGDLVLEASAIFCS